MAETLGIFNSKVVQIQFFYSITTLFFLLAVNGPGAGEFDGPN
jgi:hypothetical protein